MDMGLCFFLIGALMVPTRARGGEFAATDAFYTQFGTDLDWQELLDATSIPIGRNSTDGITGSKVSVNRALVEQGGLCDQPDSEGDPYPYARQ